MSDLSGFSLVTSDINAANGSVSVWDGCTGVNLMVLNGNKLSNNSMAVVRDTVVGCVDSKSLLEVWKLNNEGKKKVIPLPSPGRAIEYSATLNMLACFLGNEVFIWQPDTGTLLTVLRHVHSSLGTAIKFTNSNRLLTVDESGLVVLWILNMAGESDCLWKCRPFGVTTVFTSIIEHTNTVLVAADNGKMIIISLLDGSSMSDMMDVSMTVHCVLTHKDRIFIGCNNSTLATLDLNTMCICTRLFELPSEIEHCISHLTLTPDQTTLIVVTDRVSAVFVDLRSDHIISMKVFKFGSPLNCVRVVPKTGDMFVVNKRQSKMIIKRLEFALSSDYNRNIEVDLGERRMTAKEMLAAHSGGEVCARYAALRAACDQDVSRRDELVAAIFAILK